MVNTRHSRTKLPNSVNLQMRGVFTLIQGAELNNNGSTNAKHIINREWTKVSEKAWSKTKMRGDGEAVFDFV